MEELKPKEKSKQIKQMRRFSIRLAKRHLNGRRLNRNEIEMVHEMVKARINAG